MAEMSPLRRRMIEDMTVRNLSPATQRSYLHAVAKFSRHFGRAPDQLGLEEVRAYQVHLVATGISWPSLNQIVCALRFFYGGAVAQPGGGAVRGGAEFGDQVGGALPGDRQRRAGQDGRPQETDAARRARRLADRPMPGEGLHDQPAGGGALGGPRAEGRPPLGLGVPARRRAELKKKSVRPGAGPG